VGLTEGNSHYCAGSGQRIANNLRNGRTIFGRRAQRAAALQVLIRSSYTTASDRDVVTPTAVTTRRVLGPKGESFEQFRGGTAPKPARARLGWLHLSFAARLDVVIC